MAEQRNTHASLQKGLSILMAFAPHNEKMAVVALSKKLGYHPSTTTRLLKVLKKNHFVEQDPATKEYYLGRATLFLAHAIMKSLDTELVTIARPFIDSLRDRIGETAGLEVWAGDTTILAYAASGPQLIQVSTFLGLRMPVHVAAGARAILAHLPTEVVDSLLEGKLRRFTPKTITDPKVLKRKLKEVRRKGISMEKGEIDPDVHIIAAPVFDSTSQPVAAVVIAGPAYRMKTHMRGKSIALLKETALQISARLYYPDAQT